MTTPKQVLAERKRPRRTKTTNGKEPHHFNYRFVVLTQADGSEVWSLREVYYDEQEKVIGWGEDPVPLVAESYEGIRDEVLNFVEALVHPAWDVMAKEWIASRAALDG
jgi:hypothetical protein